MISLSSAGSSRKGNDIGLSGDVNGIFPENPPS